MSAATHSDTRRMEQAQRGRNLSWYGRMRAALCEVGRPDLADRIGYRGNDRLRDKDGNVIALLPGGSVPTFSFSATEEEWRIIATAWNITQRSRHFFRPWTHDEFVSWNRSLGRVVEP